MAPPARPRHTRIPKEKFSVYFGHLKSQPYIEAPAGRGAGSHHRCVSASACACACARLSCEAHLERGSSRKARSMLTTTAAVVSVLLPGILSGPLSRQALRTRRFVSVSCPVVPHPLAFQAYGHPWQGILRSPMSVSRPSSRATWLGSRR